MELLFGLFLIFFGAKIFGAILAAVVGIVGFFFSLAAQFAGFILSAFGVVIFIVLAVGLLALAAENMTAIGIFILVVVFAWIVYQAVQRRD